MYINSKIIFKYRKANFNSIFIICRSVVKWITFSKLQIRRILFHSKKKHWLQPFYFLCSILLLLYYYFFFFFKRPQNFNGITIGALSRRVYTFTVIILVPGGAQQRFLFGVVFLIQMVFKYFWIKGINKLKIGSTPLSSYHQKFEVHHSMFVFQERY